MTERDLFRNLNDIEKAVYISMLNEIGEIKYRRIVDDCIRLGNSRSTNDVWDRNIRRRG